VIIGLTGGIGSGKSTVSRILKNKGIDIVDADCVAHEVVEPGTPAFAEIKKHFGSEILQGGALNRALLRQVIFSDPEQKQWLETLLHPIIHNELLRQLKMAKSAYKILEAPLLLENHLQGLCYQTVLVDVPARLQLERASQRDGTAQEQIQAIIASQMPRKQKRQLADIILDNSADKATLTAKVEALHLRLLALAKTENNHD
jgi:dephospho-CoA kinase